MKVDLGDGGPQLDISDAAQARRIVESAYLYCLTLGYTGTAAMLAAAKLALEAELLAKDSRHKETFNGYLEGRADWTQTGIRQFCAFLKLPEPD